MRNLRNPLFLLSAFLFAWVANIQAESVGAQLDMDAAGNAISVWEDSTLRVIKSATFTAGGPWSPVTIISDQTVGSIAPMVVMNSLGQSVAIWSFYDPINNVDRLAAAMRSTGGWGPVSVISAANESVVDGRIGIMSPSYRVRMTAGSIAVVTYLSNLNNQIVVRSSSATFGGSWSFPVTISN